MKMGEDAVEMTVVGDDAVKPTVVSADHRVEQGTQNMDVEQHNRSDHDRNDPMEGVRGPGEGTKRIYDGDSGVDSQRVKRRRMGDGGPGLERLHAEMGPLYMLCRMRKALP